MRARHSAGCSDRHAVNACGRSATEQLYCPYFHHTIELLGRRWTGVILRELLDGAQRFCEVRSAIPGLSDRLLAERLDELEREGLVVRDAAEHVSYGLTERGQSLGPVLMAIGQYAAQWADACQPADRPGRIR
jgi:DNA-binding HxlR family transcriptional regulator